MSNFPTSQNSTEASLRPIEPDGINQNTHATPAVPVQDNHFNSQSRTEDSAFLNVSPLPQYQTATTQENYFNSQSRTEDSVFLSASPLPQYQTTTPQEIPPPAYTPRDANVEVVQMETSDFDYFNDDLSRYKGSPMINRSGWDLFNWIFWALVNTLILVLTCILIREHFVFAPHEAIQAGFTIFLLLEVTGRTWLMVAIFSEINGRMTLIEMLAVLIAGKEGYLLLGFVPLSRKRAKHRYIISDIVFTAYLFYLLYMLAKLGVPRNKTFDISLAILTLAIFFVFIRLIVHWCSCDDDGYAGCCSGSGYGGNSAGWWWCYYSGDSANYSCDCCGGDCCAGCGDCCAGCDGCGECCSALAECCGSLAECCNGCY